VANIHHCDDCNKTSHRYLLRFDPDAILIPLLQSDHRGHINLVLDSRQGASVATVTDSQPPDNSQYPAASTAITGTLHTILAQLTTMNKHLELQ
jgi:hypothetical protein